MDRDPAYLLDMLDTAQEVKELSSGLTLEGFEKSRIHLLGLARLLGIIGEAARAISETPRKSIRRYPGNQ